MERQVDEKFIKKTLSRLRCSSHQKCPAVLPLSTECAAKGTDLSLSSLSPQVAGQEAVFQTQLEAKGKEIPGKEGGLLLLSTRLNKQNNIGSIYIYIYMNGKRRTNF